MAPASKLRTTRVWDWSVRLFHWVLLVVFLTLFITARLGAMRLHFLAGGIVLTLVAFRLIWGVVGSQTARFSSFIVGPRRLLGYLRSGRKSKLGHNPLGGLMVIAMLATLLGQVTSGLFATGDSMIEGPLAHLIAPSLSMQSYKVHRFLSSVLLSLSALHVLAIAFHWLVLKENLVLPMLTGRAKVQADMADASMAANRLALVVWGLVLGGIFVAAAMLL